MSDTGPTKLTQEDIDLFVKDLLEGRYDPKEVACRKCLKSHFPGYGDSTGECDQCFFDRFPKEDVRKFCRSFFE